MPLDSNDWLHDRLCLVCWASPCACSWLTGLLERLVRWLNRRLTRRHRRRQQVLNHA